MTRLYLLPAELGVIWTSQATHDNFIYLWRRNLPEKDACFRMRPACRSIGYSVVLVALLAFSDDFVDPVLLPAAAADAGSSNPFGIGEKLVFLVEWNPPWYLFFLPPMEAGEAELRVSEEIEYQGKKALKLEFIARSSGALVKMVGMQINDHFVFITDPETFCTYAVSKKEREGKRKRDIEVVYLRESRQLHILDLDVSVSPPKVRKDLYRNDIPECVQDLFSALYFARRRDLQAGLKFRSVIGDNERIKEVEARVEKSETVHTPAGNYTAWRINTISLVGGLFKEGGQFRMWLSNDEHKIPVQFEAKVNLGTVSGKLKSHTF